MWCLRPRWAACSRPRPTRPSPSRCAATRRPPPAPRCRPDRRHGRWVDRRLHVVAPAPPCQGLRRALDPTDANTPWERSPSPRWFFQYRPGRPTGCADARPNCGMWRVYRHLRDAHYIRRSQSRLCSGDSRRLRSIIRCRRPHLGLAAHQHDFGRPSRMSLPFD